MRSFCFLSFMIYALTLTAHSYCMLTALIKRKKIYSPVQRNYCLNQIALHRKIESLEIRVSQQQQDLAHIKAFLSRWNNNDFPLSMENDHFLGQPFVGDSYIEKYNMHAPVREEKR